MERFALTTTRKARTLSQSELAYLVGLTQRQISRIEKGLTRPTPEKQTRIAAILGVSRAELFG